MSEDFIGLLLLAGLVIWLMYGRRGRREPPVADQIARIEGLLVDLNARLQALEQWATQAPGTQFQPMLPTTIPPDAAATIVSPSQEPPSLPLVPSSPLTSSTVPVGAQLTARAASSAAVPAPIATGATESPSTVISAAPAETSPTPSIATPPRRPPWSFADLEQLLSGRGLAWLGGLAILIGALFFLGLAFTRGWIGPGTRVTIGLIAGGLLAAGGAWFFERREALFGHVLVAVGLGTISMGLVAATRLYGLLPAPVGLLGALITAGAATTIAIRADSQVVAGYGLVTALAAPPLLGAEPTLTTIAFLATALLGTTIIALYRAWTWLPMLAFLLAAPQLAAWLLDGAGLGAGLTALAGFGMLNGIAAGGEEFRRPRKRLLASSATLLLANAAFLLGTGFAFLGLTEATAGRGLYLCALALVHFVLGGYFLREDERHPFGMLAFGTGIAALTMAIPVQLGGPVVPLAWAAEATALTWVYARRAHGYSGSVAGTLGTLAVGHLVMVEYPFWRLGSDPLPPVPFVNADGGTLAFILLAIIVAGLLVGSWTIRALLAAVAWLLLAYTLPFELRGLPLLAGWSIVSVGAVATASLARAHAGSDRDLVQNGLLLPAAIAGMLALGWTLAVELPPDRMGSPPRIPFADRESAAAAIMIAAFLASGWAARAILPRRVAVVAVVAMAGYLMPFELRPAAIVVAWALLGLALCLLGRRDTGGSPVYLTTGGVLLGMGLLLVLGNVAPPTRLAVRAGTTIDHVPFWSGASAALAAIIAVLVLAKRLYPAHRVVRWGTVLAGALGVYLLSVGTVDVFQSRVTDDQLLSVGRQAQVALSILWATLGGATFIMGVARWHAVLRMFGLALLALATAKVFLYDLAALDATYKVLSFIGLGILLLASSYAYQRLKPHVISPPVAQPEGE